MNKVSTAEEKLPLTRVLPIVGLDVGAIGCMSLFGFGSGWTLSIWLFVFIFIKSFSIELRLPGGGFSTTPPSTILVRYVAFRDTALNSKKY